MSSWIWEILPSFGQWLRGLSLAGGTKNIWAWGIVLGLTVLPALGLLWRGRSKWDLLLLLAAGEIFAGLYFLVNPSLLTAEYEAGPMWGGTALWGVLAAMLAWAVLRWMERIDRAGSPGRTLQWLLRGAGWLLEALIAAAAVFGTAGKMDEVRAGNTALAPAELRATFTVLIVLAVLEAVPAVWGCELLAWGGKLARRLDEDPFGEDTLAEAEKLRGRCGKIAGASVLVCAGGNLLQMVTFPMLRSINVNVSFPVLTVLLAAALGLLCRYFRRAKAVSDDNESII